MLSLICMPTMHSYIPKYAGNKSAFCSTVTAQIKPWEEIVGHNVTTRPMLKAKSGRSCTILWWKRPIICVGLICANKQHSLEFPTDQPGIHLKTRELVKQGDPSTSLQSIKYLMSFIISNQQQQLKIVLAAPDRVKETSMLALMSAEASSRQNLQVTKLHLLRASAVPPACPSQAVAHSSNLLQQLSPEIITSYSATLSCCDLCWSCRFIAHAGSAQSHVDDTCLLLVQKEGCTTRLSNLCSRGRAHTQRSAMGLQPVVTLTQKWHFQGNSR